MKAAAFQNYMHKILPGDAGAVHYPPRACQRASYDRILKTKD
jgi:hypothetical protein